MKHDFIHTRTVIVGAGMAGISTAVNLLKNRYSDFLMFEALERIGGRINTIDYGNSFIEMGAQFIHGQANNPIYYIARQNKQIEEKYNTIQLNDLDNDDSNGLNIEINELAKSELSYYFTTHTGQKIDLRLANEIYQISNKAVRSAEEFSEVNDSSCFKDVSVADFMYNKYTDLISERFGTELKTDGELKRLTDGIFVWRCKCENVENGCDSMFKVSLNNFNTFEELPGSQIIQTTSGYGNILNILIEKQRDEFYSRLHLNHSLSKILICKYLSKKHVGVKQIKCLHCQYTKERTKVVVLISTSSRVLVVICDNVVCTMGLGFLKKNIKQLVEPGSFVPNEKLVAISRLGFGTINKIFLIYEIPFWNNELTGIYPIALLEKTETIYSKLNDSNEFNWCEYICYFEPGKDNKNVLCAWISGCQFIETFTDERITKDCTEYLKKILRSFDIPEPKKLLRSSWGSDPYFNGSYSYLPLGSYPSDFRNIANPICLNNKPLVMFAGEATIRKYYSTVHGAYISGEREAQRILNGLNDNKRNLL